LSPNLGARPITRWPRATRVGSNLTLIFRAFRIGCSLPAATPQRCLLDEHLHSDHDERVRVVVHKQTSYIARHQRRETGCDISTGQSESS
jgi:hypothetical protein